MSHTGIVDEDVDAAEPFPGRRHELIDLVRAAYVADGGIHLDPARLDGGLGEERLSGDVAPRHVEIVESDRGTALGELEAAAFGVMALARGETISAAWLVVAAVCTYAVAYRFYSRFIATRVFQLDPRRATPAERLNDGRDFVPTQKWVLFGHHFAAIA